MRQRHIASDAKKVARNAASELVKLQSAVRAAENTLSGLHRALHITSTTSRKRVMRGTTQSAPYLSKLIGRGVGSFLSYDIRTADDPSADYFSSSSFYRSSGQLSGELLRDFLQGQRIL